MMQRSLNTLADARERLDRPAMRRQSAMALLGAAGLAALGGLALCAAVILGPPQALSQHAPPAVAMLTIH